MSVKCKDVSFVYKKLRDEGMRMPSIKLISKTRQLLQLLEQGIFSPDIKVVEGH